MKFHVSHKTDGVYQALLVEAPSEKIAEAYFREQKPESKVLGIHVATRDDMKPGKPVLVVPDEFRLEFIREHQRAFNEKMRELESKGFRSGGWDEKTDKTAIVKPGKFEHENRIVGYLDRELDIEWETKVLSVSRADVHYLEGTVFVEGEVYPFDYNVETEAVDIHCYSEPGWITGASYEKPLPEVVSENMDEILGAIDDAVHEFLSVEELKKEQGLTVDELLANAQPRAQEGNSERETVDFVK